MKRPREPTTEEWGKVGRSGPVIEDGFSNFLYFVASDEPLRPLSPSLVIPDEGQSWVLVQCEDSWFTWVPIRLLLTVESSIDQVTKIFDFMTDCPVTFTVSQLELYVSDDLASFLHSHASKVNDKKQGEVVLRVKLKFVSFPTDDDHDEYTQLPGPATVDFLKSRLLRFEIGGDDVGRRGGDHIGQCSICLEELEKRNGGELAARMPCGHLFHDVCITKWLNISGSCPVCKFEADRDQSCNSGNNDHITSDVSNNNGDSDDRKEAVTNHQDDDVGDQIDNHEDDQDEEEILNFGSEYSGRHNEVERNIFVILDY